MGKLNELRKTMQTLLKSEDMQRALEDLGYTAETAKSLATSKGTMAAVALTECGKNGAETESRNPTATTRRTSRKSE